MEEIERRDCAIEHFEAVLDEREVSRATATDAMLRLLSLYEKEGDEPSTRELLRRFWDVGTLRRPGAQVPYSARYLSAELDVLMVVDLPKFVQAPIWRQIAFDVPQYLFTCDDGARDKLVEDHRWRRAREIAAREGRRPDEVHAELVAQAEQWRESSKNGGGGRGFGSPPTFDLGEPIFSVTLCRILQALGDKAPWDWTRITGAMSHQDFDRSMAIAEVPELDRKLAAATESGALRSVGEDRWVLEDWQYAGQPVHLVRLDKGELTFGRADMIEPVVDARRRRKKRWHRDIARLVDTVPRDPAFFVVVTAAAATGMSPSNVSEAQRNLMQALLPKPRGVQVAGLVADRVGVFTRMYTEEPVKGQMLVSMARWLIAQQGADPKVEQWLRYLDVSATTDGDALIGSYVLPAAQLRRMFGG